MFINKEILLKLKNVIKIEEIISDFLLLKKRGGKLWSYCPFHRENTPSFFINTNKGFYKCFGCGSHGDSIEFIKNIKGINFAKSVEYLLGKYHLNTNTNKITSNNYLNFNKENNLHNFTDLVKNYYIKNLLKKLKYKNPISSYFKNVIIPNYFIEKFELGYSLKKHNSISLFLKKLGYKDFFLKKNGLVFIKKDKTFDFFINRVMFPIHNISGNIIGFGGRIIGENINNYPKYINTPETFLYKKNKSLYGIYQAKREIKNKNNCYIVEGYTDVISLHISGIKNVVSVSCTSITKYHINTIRRFSNNIVILFDGDIAGINGSLKSIDIILYNGMNVNVILLPNKEDPDSYSKKIGSYNFKKYVEENSKDFITFQYDLLVKKCNNNFKKSEYIKKILNTIFIIPDSIKVSLFIKHLSSILNMDESVFNNYRNKYFLCKKKYKKKENKNLKNFFFYNYNINNLILKKEKDNIYTLIKYNSYKLYKNILFYPYILSEFQFIKFITFEYNKIFHIFNKEPRNNTVFNKNYFLKKFSDNIKTFIINVFSNDCSISSEWNRYKIYLEINKNLFTLLYKNILRLKFMIVKKIIDYNYKKLKFNDLCILLKLHNYLKKIEKRLANKLGIVIYNFKILR